jgi:putative tryptophan/tyrosine transport system substrate-binding protein
MMRRRTFITGLGAAAVWPLAVRAQQVGVPIVGVLSSTSKADEANAPLLSEVLAELGFVDGRNVTLEYHWADGQYDRLPAMADDLVRRRVAVIYAGLVPATMAAKAATTTIPIVFAIGGDPIEQGVVASMNRPEGNVTGVNFYTSKLGSKRLQLLRELVPEASTIAVLINPGNQASELDSKDLREAALALGQHIMILPARSPEEIDAAFARMSNERAGAVVVSADPLFSSRADQLVALAAKYRIAASYFNRNFTARGGLISYADDRPDLLRQAAVYVSRILKGEKPAALPVLQPSKFQLVINVGTAKSLGLTVPPSFLATADEVIE